MKKWIRDMLDNNPGWSRAMEGPYLSEIQEDAVSEKQHEDETKTKLELELEAQAAER